MHDISILAGELFATLIQEKESDQSNWIIVGSKSTGKTMLVSKILELVETRSSADVYYIDPQNRTVIDQEIEGGYSQDLQEVSPLEILLNRKRENNFTKQDVFNTQLSGGAIAFAELVKRFEFYKGELEEFLGKTLECKQPEVESEDFLNKWIEEKQRIHIYINGDQEIARLSNSEAAKMRLIMEIMLAQEKGCHSIIIDEFDSHFDNVTMVDFMNQISEKFSNMRFLFVIHNFESLVQIWNMKAVIFNMSCTPGTYEHVIDTNDISQIGDAYKTFNKYLGRKKETEIFLSDCLSDFMENDKLSAEVILDIQKLNRKELNKREKIIYDYLKEKYEK